MSILASVQVELAERQEQRDGDFRTLAAAVVAGDIEPGEVVDKLARLGKTASDLQTAVSYTQRRLEWHREADLLPEREAAAQAAEAAREKLAADWREIEKSYLATLQQAGEAAQVASRELGQSYNALTQLRKSYKGPLLQQLAEVQAEEREAARRLAEVKARRGRATWQLDGPLAAMRIFQPKDIDTLERRIDAADADAARLTAQIADCHKRAKQIEAGMTQP